MLGRQFSPGGKLGANPDHSNLTRSTLMTTVQIRATLLLSVDVDAIREEQGDDFDSETTDQEIATEFVEGEGGASIDNFILIEDIESAEVVAEPEP